MSPKDVVREWVRLFNQADVDGIVELYAPEAVNHQVVMDPIVGRDAVRDMFTKEFTRASMTCIIENIFEDGDWAILEWSDPNGLRGCGFFHIKDEHIVFQRGYFDQLTFFRKQGISLPETYL